MAAAVIIVIVLLMFVFTAQQTAGYLPQAVLEEGLKTGRFVSGCLNVNRFNAMSEAFISGSGYDDLIFLLCEYMYLCVRYN